MASAFLVGLIGGGVFLCLTWMLLSLAFLHSDGAFLRINITFLENDLKRLRSELTQVRLDQIRH